MIAEEFFRSPGGCLVKGTQISTVGGLKNVEDIQKGDRVYTYDRNGGEVIESTVESSPYQVRTMTYNISLSNGASIQASWDHPFFVLSNISGFITDGPVQFPEMSFMSIVDGLRVRSTLLAIDEEGVVADGNAVYITDIREAGIQDVYNFKVANFHNYFAAGVAVHNK